jgi:nucleotide-binding universal stress UspA family protein
MVRFNKILVPTDFSDGAKTAYVFANELAAKFGGKIDLIHIIPTMRYLSESISNLGLPFDMDKDVFPKLIDQSRGFIEDDLTNYIDEKYAGKSIIKIDMKAFDVITETAASGNYDIIVMGTQGASANQFLKGNVTEKVIRYSKVPVLCVPNNFSTENIRKVLIPIDLSANSWKAMPMAASFAAAIGGELTLIHVKELYGSDGEIPPHTSDRDEALILRDNLLTKFAEYADANSDFDFELKSLGDREYDVLITEVMGQPVEVKVHTEIRKGVSAHYEITDYANDNADILVMTTHGRSGLKHIFLGSTTEKVARYSKIPVITIRPNLD